MALFLADRVQQTGTANTTVSFTLSGSVTGFQTFAAANIANNDTTYYGATDTSGNWEVGVGTYSTTGPTLTRTTILSSSNSGSAVTFSGTVSVFITYPAERSVYSNGTNIVPDNAATLLTTSGGTGLSSYTAGDLPYYATGTALSKLTIGASGRWLGSSGTAPQWNAPAALTKTDDTNVTLTLGGSASTALLNAASLTLGWTGQLGLTRGGTNASLTASAGSVAYSTASALALNTAGSSGDWLKSAGTAAPTWTAPAALTKTDDTNVTLTLGGSASTALLNDASLTLGWTGQLATTRGGTGLSSFTADGVVYASSTSALATSSQFTFNATNGVGIGRTPIGSTYILSTVTGKNTSIGMPTDAWTFTGANIEASGTGGIWYSHGSFRASWSCNGYRDNTSPTNTWTSLGINAQSGAAMIEQDPSGLILFRTEATKATGSSPTVTERLRIGSDGRIQINGSNTLTSSLVATANNFPLAVAASAYQFRAEATFDAANTSAVGFGSTYQFPSSGTFTSSYQFYGAGIPALTGTATLTNNFGLYIAAQTAGTNIYGVHSNIAAASNRWNFYANGTADNYFAGKVGIGVTTPSFGLDISSSSRADSSISLTCTDAGALAGPYIELFRISASPANNDVLGAIYFEGANSAASFATYAAIESVIGNVTSTAEDGILLFKTLLDGTYAERMRINTSGNLQVTGAISATATITGGYNNPSAGTTAMAFGSYNVVKVTPNATATYTTTVPAAGTQCTLIILTSGTTSYTITFGTGFKTTGTLATGGTSARYFMLSFVSDGTNVLETARTVAIA